MTEKEKAKAYDEAIERAKELYGNGITEEIFPELKEDNDEKIRRWIIDDIRYNMNNEPLNNSEYKKKAEKAIAWLETQGEQKPTLPKQKYKKDNTPLLRDSIILNKYGGVAKSPSGAIVSDALVLDYDELAKLPKEEKIEPKFKVGDKITNSFRKYVGASGSQSIISEITDNKYIFTDGSYIFISNQDSWELAPDKNPKFDPETLKTYNDINIGDTVYIWGRGDSSVDETTITEKYDDRGHWNLKFSNGCVGRALKNGTSSTMGMYDCLVYSDKEAVRESINERIKILSNIKI